MFRMVLTLRKSKRTARPSLWRPEASVSFGFRCARELTTPYTHNLKNPDVPYWHRDWFLSWNRSYPGYGTRIFLVSVPTRRMYIPGVISIVLSPLWSMPERRTAPAMPYTWYDSEVVRTLTIIRPGLQLTLNDASPWISSIPECKVEKSSTSTRLSQ